MTISLPPDVFARLEPEVYLQRHLELGLRPGGLRALDEFRPVTIHSSKDDTGKDQLPDTVGSAVVNTGGTSVLCGISAGVTETRGKAGIYPNVEIIRGTRPGLPTQEEMVFSQRIYQLLNKTGVVDKSTFTIEGAEDAKWLVLTANVQVLSRTGPCFDAIWNAVVGALESCEIPQLEVDPDTRQVVCVDGDKRKVVFSGDAGSSAFYSSTYGVGEVHKTGETVVVADLEGETEEAGLTSRINVVANASGLMTGFSLSVASGTGLHRGIRVERQHIEEALAGAFQRGQTLAT